jgi:outer membrane lipoprotein SlyB
MNLKSKALMLVLLFSGCSTIEDLTGSNPIIDRQGVNLAHYDQNLIECQQYANEVEIARKAGTGAIGGAVIGGVFGAVLGNSNTAKRGAGVGVVGGAAKGVGQGLHEREAVIKRCLTGRGYRVLN